MALEGPSFIPKEPKKALLLLHGFGSNGDDLAGIIDPLEGILPSGERLKTAYYAPNAPLELPFGGYAWFDDKNWTFRDREGIETAKNLLWDYIEQHILSLSIKIEDVFILGFSQGAMTTLFSAPRWPECVGGIIAHSGRLMWEEELDKNTCHKPPMLILHGTEDDVVPPQEGQKASTGLQNLGFDVTSHLIPNLGHGLNAHSIKYISDFMLKS